MVRKSKKLPRHLIVYRTSAMGDVAMLAHALRALKRAYPDLQVTVATRPLFRAFFTDLDVGFLDVDVKAPTIRCAAYGGWPPKRGGWGRMPWPTCTACCVR